MDNISATGLNNLTNFNFQSWDENLKDKVTFAEYIWIDGTGQNMRSKTKIYNKKIEKLEDCEWWSYDGSSCLQATTIDSEIYLKPVFLCRDPLRKENAVLVLCETYHADKKTPAKGNFRWIAEKVMKDASAERPWFGLEQEYFLFVRKGTSSYWPLYWPDSGFPFPQGRYYCGAGTGNCFGRAVAEAHARACVAAGLKIAGINAEVAPSQWEYQVGITEGIECGDHHWVSRYILNRIGEEFGVDIVLDPKPVKGDWNGSGCHTNFSTESTRAEGGLDVILKDYLPKMDKAHKEHLLVYGEDNQHRLTGHHETSSMEKFSYGLGNRGASVRIPITTMASKNGYFEDRRPAANIDPYLVSAMLVDTTVLDGKHREVIVGAYEKFKKSA